MNAVCFVLLSVYSLLYSPVLSQAFSDDITAAIAIIQQLRLDLRAAFDASGKQKPLLATTVRLIFHDCAGPIELGDLSTQNSICNGCVSFRNIGNRGLQNGAVLPLEFIYSSYHSFMSRADFWAAAATIAIEYAQELDQGSRGDILPSIPFYFGREDCATSPDGLQHKEFPHGHAASRELLTWFQRNLGLGKQHSVALLGAHTLGRTRVENSGFGTAPWVRRSFELNNQYYHDIIEKKWTPEKVNCRSAFGCQWEWHAHRSDHTLMLNADMAIWNDIEPFLNRRTGRVSCDWKTCPLNPSTKDITRSYARNNQVWLNHFAEAFELLITTGYDARQLLAIQAPAAVAVRYVFFADVFGGVMCLIYIYVDVYIYSARKLT